MSDYPIYVWRAPDDWAEPTSLEDMSKTLQRFESSKLNFTSSRIIAFAEDLMKRYPPSDQQLSDDDDGNEESEAPWTTSVVPEARSTTSGVFSLQPPGGDIDLVRVLSDIVDLAGQLGLTVLHEMSGLGFLPNGKVVPEGQQEMWEGAKEHVQSATRSELKLTAARARKVFSEEIEPTLKRIGFSKDFGTKGALSYYRNRWTLKFSEIHIWFFFGADQTKYGDVRLGGTVYFNCPLITALWLQIDPKLLEGGHLGHGVSVLSVSKLTGDLDPNIEESEFTTSEDAVRKFAQTACTQLLPWATSISTIAELNRLIYPNKAEVAQELQLHGAVYYLCIAYVARNPYLRQIEANWIERATSTKFIHTGEILAAAEYLNAHPLA